MTGRLVALVLLALIASPSSVLGDEAQPVRLAHVRRPMSARMRAADVLQAVPVGMGVVYAGRGGLVGPGLMR